MTTTNKYLIEFGKFSRWEPVDGVETLVTRKPGDIIDLTAAEAQAKQQSVRLATVDDIATYEKRLRGELDPPAPIPVEHVSTAGAPPAPTPPSDPLQPPATAENPPARHFPEPASSVPVAAPVVPVPVPAPVPVSAPVAPIAAPAPVPVAVPAAPVAPVAPVAVPAAQSVGAPTPSTTKPVPAAPPISERQRASNTASAKAENEGKPKARSGGTSRSGGRSKPKGGRR